MTMKRTEALRKIEELRIYVEELDSRFPRLVRELRNDHEIMLNGNKAGCLFSTEEQASSKEGAKISGHEAIIYLGYAAGQWYNEQGKEIQGYLFFKPRGE